MYDSVEDCEKCHGFDIVTLYNNNNYIFFLVFSVPLRSFPARFRQNAAILEARVIYVGPFA